MSFILDALRKAERDRNLGRPPSLGDVTANRATASRRGMSRRTRGLLLLVAGLALLSLLIWSRTPPPVQVAAPVEAPSPEPVAATVSTPRLEPEAEIQAPPEPIDPTIDAVSLDDLLGQDEVLADEAGAADELAGPGTVAEPQVDLAPPVPVEPEPVPVAPPAAPPTVPPATVPVPPPAEAIAAPAGAPRPLREMPPEYRASFPELRVDVHVYDADPARRWALVNGRKLLEGGTLAEGPRLLEITAEGLVFEFSGRSTLLPLDRGR